MQPLHLPTRRGIVLDGVLFSQTASDTKLFSQTASDTKLFSQTASDTVLICITGIHGNFRSNPFYFNIGHTLADAGIDFIYAQTNDAYGMIRTTNTLTGKEEIIGSWNERFAYTDEDIEAYLDYAEQTGYKHIILAGHSLGANKVIYYLSRHHSPRVERFVLLSPANLTYMLSEVTAAERLIVRRMTESGRGGELLPFYLMGWVQCIAFTAHDWLFDSVLNNVHTSPDGDFSQAAQITHTGALFIGTYDNFTDGDPVGFLTNLNNHIPTADRNRLIFIERTGHTYQQKEQELADRLLETIQAWRKEK